MNTGSEDQLQPGEEQQHREERGEDDEQPPRDVGRRCGASPSGRPDRRVESPVTYIAVRSAVSRPGWTRWSKQQVPNTVAAVDRVADVSARRMRRPMAEHPGRPARIRAIRRDGEQVTPLELFFDLVFVLALTQCTTLIVDRPTWAGIGQGLLVLGLLWWAWVGYAWLTSVVDPEEGAVRLVDVRGHGRLPRRGAGRSRRVRRRRHRAGRSRTAWCASRRSRCSCSPAADEPLLRRSVLGSPGAPASGCCSCSSAPSPRGGARGAVGGGAADGHGGAVLLRRRGLAARARPTSPNATG